MMKKSVTSRGLWLGDKSSLPSRVPVYACCSGVIVQSVPSALTRVLWTGCFVVILDTRWVQLYSDIKFSGHQDIQVLASLSRTKWGQNGPGDPFFGGGGLNNGLWSACFLVAFTKA